jgi:hypothetical protein
VACWGDKADARQKGLTSMLLRVAAADRVMPYMPSCAPCTWTSFPAVTTTWHCAVCVVIYTYSATPLQ